MPSSNPFLKTALPIKRSNPFLIWVWVPIIIVLYATLMWTALPVIGTQIALSGYFLAAIGTWYLGLKKGFFYTAILITITILCIRYQPGVEADKTPIKAVIGSSFFIIIYLFSGSISRLFYKLKHTQKLLKQEYEKSEILLRNTLPDSIAERLKNGDVLIADNYQETTVLFCDLVGFTKLTRKLTPVELIEILNKVVTSFDNKAEELGVEKIKTIGDAYMVVAGLPEEREDHALVLTKMALEMLQEIERLNLELKHQLQLRIGLHSGPVVGGVIGTKKFTFDMWGDTVNLAARLESHGLPGQIHISESTYQLVKDHFKCISAGGIQIRSYGDLQTYFVENK